MLVRIISFILLLSSPIAFANIAISVTDDSGSKVELKKPATRIVALAPHITELLYESGAGKQVIGVVDYSDFPEEAKSKSKVGSYVNINIEAVLALNPDLIVAYTGGNPPRQLEQLKKLDIPIYFSNPKSIPEIISNIRKMGQLTGHEKQATQRADQLQQRYIQLTKKYAKAEPVSIFIQIWDKPLMSVDNSHIIGQAVEICGGKNLFPSMVSAFAQVSIESVISRNPQAILMMETHVESKKTQIISPEWSTMQATTNSQLLSIDENLLYRASGRLLDGTEQLCKKLDGTRKYYTDKAHTENKSFSKSP